MSKASIRSESQALLEAFLKEGKAIKVIKPKSRKIGKSVLVQEAN